MQLLPSALNRRLAIAVFFLSVISLFMYANRTQARQTASGEQSIVYAAYRNKDLLGLHDYRAYGNPLIVIEDRTSAFWSRDTTFLGGLRHFLFVAFQRKRTRRIQPKISRQPWRLIGLAWAGKNKDAIQKATRDLFAAQRSDGGWSDLPSMDSTLISP
jgi:hypothetical protein